VVPPMRMPAAAELAKMKSRVDELVTVERRLGKCTSELQGAYRRPSHKLFGNQIMGHSHAVFLHSPPIRAGLPVDSGL
jgi:hypothetical protein